MAYDNLCKYLVEQYPTDFARWLFSAEVSDVTILKTELSLEPIHADSVTFLQTSNQILHLEFQTVPESDPPLPLRMLDYWVRLHRQYRCPVEQVVIFLKRSTSVLVFTNQFVAPNTWHRYRVIRLWEQNPAPLLENTALLPLATLAQTNSPIALLEQVAQRVATIEAPTLRQNISACVQVLAGLRFEKNLIRGLLRREIMRESVIYQEILQEGLIQGRQQVVQLILDTLEIRFGETPSDITEQLMNLTPEQLRELHRLAIICSSVPEFLSNLPQ